MRIEKKNVIDLIPASYNPRKISNEELNLLKASMDKYGCVEPIIWNERTNNIVGGHQRLKVLQAQNVKEIECVIVNLSENDEKDLNIKLNKISGEWDLDKLEIVLTDLQLADFDLTLTGFSEVELNRILKDEIVEDSFDVDSELKQPVFSQAGDLYLLGKHRILCGDSTKPESYERLMDGQKANLLLTDPPYNVNIEEKAGKIQNDNMSDKDFYKFLFSAFSCMFLNLADDGSFYVFHADKEAINFRTALQDAGFYIMQGCVWVKNNIVMGRSPYQWKHEPVLFGKKLKGKHCWYADRKQTTVWEYDKPQRSELHPTMKPIQLMAYPIRNSTMTNGVVLDPFLGSGSTLIACEETERICRGIELEPKFVDVIVQRYYQYTHNEEIYLIRGGERLKWPKWDGLEQT